MTAISPTVSGIAWQTLTGPLPPPPGIPPANAIYQPAGKKCSCGHCDLNTDFVPCNTGDIEGPTHSCCSVFCTAQANCFSLNPLTCPTFSGGAVTATWTNSSNAPERTNYTKSVTCTYNTSIFTTTANVAAWNTAFGANDSYNNTIMPNFCIEQSTNCPGYPNIPGAPTSNLQQLTVNGQILPVCSNFVDTGTAGQLCRAWAQANPTLAQTAYENYCIANDSPDCSCINRANNSVYESIKGSTLYQQTLNAFNDGCWYLPCSSSGLFLIPSDINSSTDCETQVCQQIQTFIDNGGTINVGPVNNSINCSFSSPTGSATGATGSSNTGSSTGGNQSTTGGTTGTNNNNPTSESIWSKYKWLIIGVIIVILIIVVIFVVLSSRKKKAVPKEALKK